MKQAFCLILFILPICIYCQKIDFESFKYSDSFDSIKMKKKWYYEITENNKYYLSSDSIDGRLKDNFLITEMNSTGKNGIAKRAEIVTRLYDSIGDTKFSALSIKVPESFKYDSINLGRETMISQWHSRPAPGKSWSHYRKHNKYNRPSIALLLTTNDNVNFYIIMRYGNNGKQEFDEYGNVWSVVALKKIQLGEWNDFVFEIKWSDTSDGYIASWVNNEPYTPFNGYNNRVYGANMHNESPVSFKLGQYRYFDDSNTHLIYYDEYRVGNSFEKVSLYNVWPEMFEEIKKLKFIEDHK
nr:heparin lyase I family protein [uncultured Allomuricauda sp.]